LHHFEIEVESLGKTIAGMKEAGYGFFPDECAADMRHFAHVGTEGPAS
jgi:hypothetical protein